MEDELVVAGFRAEAEAVHEGADGDWAFFGVYDGHGGRGAVDACRDHLHQAVAAELRGLARTDSRSVHAALAAAFERVDADLHDARLRQLAAGMRQDLPGWKCGCTATAALAHRADDGELTLYVANVGDSRALIIGDGEAKRVSTDHRAHCPSEARRLQREGVAVRNGRVAGTLGVSRSIGDHSIQGVSCVPDICTYHVDGARALIIASDGLWDVVDDDEVQEVVEGLVERTAASAGDAKVVSSVLRAEAARALVDRAKERGSKDNITVLAVFF
jgi:serine/threonine protein phosphatase PrpC